MDTRSLISRHRFALPTFSTYALHIHTIGLGGHLVSDFGMGSILGGSSISGIYQVPHGHLGLTATNWSSDL